MLTHVLAFCSYCVVLLIEIVASHIVRFEYRSLNQHFMGECFAMHGRTGSPCVSQTDGFSSFVGSPIPASPFVAVSVLSGLAYRPYPLVSRPSRGCSCRCRGGGSGDASRSLPGYLPHEGAADLRGPPRGLFD